MSDEKPVEDPKPKDEPYEVEQTWPDPERTPLTPEQESDLKDKAIERAHRVSDLAWRPSVYEGMFAHLPIAEGELWAQNISATALRSIPGFAQIFDKTVPDEYVAVDLNADGFSEAQVACPCGETHRVEVGTTAVAACGRAFFWFGGDVRRASLEDEAAD